eukprot:CAMPEP_0198369236 /NCGR_PEP_ID=MMETSP1450-20131203/156105_1 /TAXON_ID=753684 ORGANISM="Madagascaria erythrocladiodes, Strain CCMP3234" /NCGR_SAMPLE_ID=MMETSP1450 /ASSEMBLY_ACC=CAM_ASM_001115 /LENGTH=871 /DNA_ID=CAMNT_0044076755 /DNA_START=1 /DNA_END=2613 /DNA_ORIENTATION=-
MDAGDGVKFNFPMAYSATVLAWGALEFPEGYQIAGAMDMLEDNLDFVADYLLRCWDNDKQQLVVGIGDPFLDHNAWIAPELLEIAVPESRQVYKVSPDAPGSDVAAEMSAALTAIGLFRKERGGKADDLMAAAQQLYKFADANRGKYSVANPIVDDFYMSWSGFHDELAWAATWLFQATEDEAFLEKALGHYRDYEQENPDFYDFTLSWDDKSYAVALMLDHWYPASKSVVKPRIKQNRNFWLNEIPVTQDGLRFLLEWGSIRYAANSALLAEIASKWSGGDEELQSFAKSQADYALGDNADDFSFVIGIGEKYPQNPHHRGAHGPYNNVTICCPDQTRNILYGALVGGPTMADGSGYQDDRSDYQANEVATDYNAGFSGLLSALISRTGETSLPEFKDPEFTKGTEFEVVASIAEVTDTSLDVDFRVMQQTNWPSRRNAFGIRYFVDLGDVKVGDISVAVIPVGDAVPPAISNLREWPEGEDVFFVNIGWPTKMAPFPFGAVHQGNFTLRLTLENGEEWDRTRDWSHPRRNAENIPVYEDAFLVIGAEPDGKRQRSLALEATRRGLDAYPPDPILSIREGDEPSTIPCDDLEWKVASSWPGGFSVDAKLINARPRVRVSWVWETTGVVIEESWNIKIVTNDGTKVELIVQNPSSFGFVGRMEDTSDTDGVLPTEIQLNGDDCFFSGREGDDSEKPDDDDDDDSDSADDDDDDSETKPESSEAPSRGSLTPYTDEVDAIFPPPGESTSMPDASDDPDSETGGENEGSVCFPEDASVELEDGSSIPMAKLALGNKVRVDVNKFEEVFFFSHREWEVTHRFVVLETEARNLTVSRNHLIPSGHGLVRAGTVTVGDTVYDGVHGHELKVVRRQW